jgi:hypothetical protein
MRQRSLLARENFERVGLQSPSDANFSEGFDNVGVNSGAGPQNLINQGWIFRNQSDAPGTPVWQKGRSSVSILHTAFRQRISV